MQDDLLLRYRKLVSRLGNLPMRMVSLYDLGSVGSIPEFVLHDLCHEDCFNLKKAAFLVDNPDFDLLKGIAGFSREERFKENHWDNPDNFNNHMANSDFNKKVKSFCEQSYKKKNKNNLENVARELNLQNPEFKTWPLKHYNHGFLLYEKAAEMEDEIFDHNFVSSLHILSFCPLH
ncbi:hypothetical protein A3F66_00430 [candidate division TM6 bacterium RIFCSPHIGHO2_12_FULL_32_22]|nr:MAG: hypothetical protein A3F66_00430 [candidate division TM6 bacterium RIFCSPHIGHO2_12_FULL_32_22]